MSRVSREACCPREGGTCLQLPASEWRDVMTPVADVFEPLQVMSLLLLKALVQVKALLKVADVFSLLSPLTRTQTTMPQTRLAARTSR